MQHQIDWEVILNKVVDFFLYAPLSQRGPVIGFLIILAIAFILQKIKYGKDSSYREKLESNIDSFRLGIGKMRVYHVKPKILIPIFILFFVVVVGGAHLAASYL